MRNRFLLLGAAALLIFTLPHNASGQACLGRATHGGEVGLVGFYEPQVDGLGAAVDWNARGLWSFRLEGATVGEFISTEELETHQGWSKIGTVIEGEEEYPIVTRRTGEEFFGAQALVEFMVSGWSLCAAGGVQGFSGEASLTERKVYLDAFGPQWVTGTQNYSGARAPLTLAAGFEGVSFADVDLIPYAAFTYWVDRVSFDRVSESFTSEGWFGRVGATLRYDHYSLGLSHRTGDDLRDQSLLASLGYSF